MEGPSPIASTLPKRAGTLLRGGLVLALLAACSPFAPEPRIPDSAALPAVYPLFDDGRADVPQQWWRVFGSAELDGLVDTALEANFTLQAAWARLRQAQARATAAAGGRTPSLAASAAASTARQRSADGPAGTRGSERYDLGLAAGFEVDLWGRVQAEGTSARHLVDAGRADLEAAAVSVAAEVAVRWVTIASQRLKQRLLQEQLDTNRTLLELVELRFRNAMVSALDVYQQKQVVAQVRAQLPLADARVRLLRNELALLLGKPPGGLPALHQAALPDPGPLPAAGLPADLLAARPDIRAAGARLTAADWQLAAARADRLPALSLSASGSVGAADLDLLLQNWIARLAANLAAPLLDGGRRAAEVARTRAGVDETLALYRRTVAEALKEVQDALIQENRQREHIRALEEEVDAARRALEEAGQRYRKGLNDYLPVLTQLLAVQRLERDLLEQRTQVIVHRINLHRALGGTWPAELVPQER